MLKLCHSRAALLQCAVLLLLSAQLCAEFLDGDEPSPGTPVLSPELMMAMGINSTQPSARAIAQERLSGLMLGHQATANGSATLTLTASPTLQLVNSFVTLSTKLEGFYTPSDVTSTLRGVDTATNQTVYGDVIPATEVNSPYVVLFHSYTRSTIGEVRFTAEAAYTPRGNESEISSESGMRASTTLVSNDVLVTFLAPTTILSAPTTNPTLGDTTVITATVTNGAGGLPLVDATVYFTVTLPDGTKVPAEAKSDSNGKATLLYPWPAAGRYTVSATTLAAGLSPPQDVAAKNILSFNVSPDFSDIKLAVRAKSDYGTRGDRYSYNGGAEGYAERPMPVMLVATVINDGGSPVSGVAVQFNIVHPCKHGRGLCGAIPQAVTNAHGQATMGYRTSSSRAAYAVATTRNNRGSIASSESVSLWSGDAVYGYP